MKPSTRNALVLAAKALVATVLIGWLVRSGHLDVSALAILIERPPLLAMALGAFTIGACIGTARFHVLLGLADVRVPLRTLFKLQMTALFFNVVIPGSIGGDVVKALYVARDAPGERRTTIVLLAFVERIVGLVALVILAALIVALRPSTWSDPLLRPLAATTTALGGATLIGGAVAIAIVRRSGARLEALLGGPSKLGKLLGQLVASLRLVSQGPRRLVAALVLSMGTHAATIALFAALARAILDKDVPYAAVATVFPIGLVTMMLPIAPSGLGVGHVAFKRLFEAIGITGGATVFNVYLLAQILFCLLGVFPFLSLRRRGALPTEAPPS